MFYEMGLRVKNVSSLLQRSIFEHTIISIGTKSINHVMGKTKWDQLRFIERQSLRRLVES